MAQLDSRDHDVELDYRTLKINSPVLYKNLIQDYSGFVTTAPGQQLTVYSMGTQPGHSYIIEFILAGHVTASTGANLGKGVFQRALNGVSNNAGVITNNIAFGNQFALNGVPSSQGIAVNGSNIDVFINSAGNLTDTIRWTWNIKLYIN